MQLDPVLEPVVHQAALRGERIVSISRIVFCVLVLARFLTLGQGVSAYVLNISALGVAIAYSVWLLFQIHHERASYAMLAASVAIDAVGSFASLLQTVLWPSSGENYHGLLTTPDAAAILLVVYCAGFRVWPRLALLGAALNLVSYAALVTTELAFRRPGIGYGIPEVLLFLFVLASVMVLSVATARRTLQLVAEGAKATVQVDRARRKLAQIVRGHHDARSVISAAALSSDMMVRVLEKEPSDAAVRHAARLREDIEAARKQLAELGEKAYVELASLGEIERVETARVLRDTVGSLSQRFPDLAIEAEIDGADDALIAGGSVSLRSMLYNLANNAREGDGRAGATRLQLRVCTEGERVEIVVEDDGPGFGPEALEAAGRSSVTTKEHGLGLGLVMVSELVRASGGTLATENLPRGGARLVISLPAAPS